MLRFTLALIGQLVAMAASEDAPAIKDSHAPTAAGTQKPGTLAPKWAGRPFQGNGVCFIFPFAACGPGAIHKDDAPGFRPYANKSYPLPVLAPIQGGYAARGKHPVLMQIAHVKPPHIACGAFPALASVAAAQSAHDAPPDIFPKSFGKFQRLVTCRGLYSFVRQRIHGFYANANNAVFKRPHGLHSSFRRVVVNIFQNGDKLACAGRVARPDAVNKRLQIFSGATGRIDNDRRFRLCRLAVNVSKGYVLHGVSPLLKVTLPHRRHVP
jgi:hypothetical protein